MPGTWCQFTVEVAAREADPLAGALWAAGVAGIEERVGRDGAVVLVVSVEGLSSEAVRAALAGREAIEERVDPTAGLDEWRRHARTVQVGAFELVPAWFGRGPTAPGVVRLVLDPGRAFGSGSHPTTKLALRAIETHLSPGAGVLDVGSGSGVLAVAAAKLGAGRVVAVDIDPTARRATTDNAARNGVADLVEVTESIPAPGRFDLVVANISREVLVELAPVIGAVVRPTGLVVLTGLLEEQAGDVAGAYRPLTLLERAGLGGWALVVLRA